MEQNKLTFEKKWFDRAMIDEVNGGFGFCALV
jgi:hypothetical protein